MSHITSIYQDINKGDYRKYLEKYCNSPQKNRILSDVWISAYLFMHSSDIDSIKEILESIHPNKQTMEAGDLMIYHLFQFFVDLELSNIENAKKTKNEIQKLLEENKFQEVSYSLLYELLNAVYLRKIGDNETSQTQFEKFHENIPDGNYLFFSATLHNNLGVMYFGQRDFGKAIADFQKGYVLFETLENKRSLLKLANNIGACYKQLGDLDNAVDYLRKGSNLASEIDDKRSFAGLMFNLGQINWTIGELKSSLKCFELARPYYISIKNENMLTQIDLNKGIVYDLKGESNVALDYFNKCLEYYKHQEDEIGIKNCYNNLGHSYQKLGEANRAFSYFQKAYQIEKGQEFKTELSGYLYDLYTVSLELENDKEQEYYLELQKYPDNGYSKLAKARELKRSFRLRNMVNAQDIYYEMLESNQFHSDLKVIAILELLDLLMFEYRRAKGDDIITEISGLLKQLDYIARSQNSYWLIGQSLLLHSKLALLKLDTVEAKKTIAKAQALAEEKSYSNLALTLSNELDILLQELQEIESAVEGNTDLIEELGVRGFGDIIQQIMHKKVVTQEYEQEIPILLLVVNKPGSTMYSRRFDESSINEQLIGGFLSAINAMLAEAFSAKSHIERVKQKEYTLLFKPCDGLMFCFVVKGMSFYASQKLDKLIRELQNAEFWPEFLKNANMGKIDHKISKIIEPVVDAILLDKQT